MNAYDKLKSHLTAHAYKRGRNVGTAPADYNRRGRTHHLVTERGATMTVLFHNTYIITAKQDGHLILDCNGYAGSPTTKTAVYDSLCLCGVRGYVSSNKIMGKSQLTYHDPFGSTVRYYDGMEIDGTGRVVSELKPFVRKRRDRAQTKAFEGLVIASGFKDMFKLLHGTCEAEDMESVLPRGADRIRQCITEEVYANMWKAVVANYTWEVEARYDHVTRTVVRKHLKRDASATWSNIMDAAKTDMYEEVVTDIYKM